MSSSLLLYGVGGAVVIGVAVTALALSFSSRRCPPGETAPGCGGSCCPGLQPDTLTGCCFPPTHTCPSPDLPPGSSGSCPPGYAPDPNEPGCCAPTG